MKKILLLLDYSGVLADKELRNDLIWKKWAELSNLPFDDCDYPKIIEGASREDGIKYFAKVKQIEIINLNQLLDNLIKAINIIKKEYPELYEDIKPLLGVKEFLEYLSKRKDVKTVIISSSGKKGIISFLKSIYPQYDGFIDIFITYEAIKNRRLRNKPYPDVYVDAMKEYNADNYDKIVIVEDSLQTIKHIREGVNKKEIPYRDKIIIIGVIHDVNKCVKEEIGKYADYVVDAKVEGINKIIDIIER